MGIEVYALMANYLLGHKGRDALSEYLVVSCHPMLLADQSVLFRLWKTAEDRGRFDELVQLCQLFVQFLVFRHYSFLVYLHFILGQGMCPNQSLQRTAGVRFSHFVAQWPAAAEFGVLHHPNFVATDAMEQISVLPAHTEWPSGDLAHNAVGCSSPTDGSLEKILARWEWRTSRGSQRRLAVLVVS